MQKMSTVSSASSQSILTVEPDLPVAEERYTLYTSLWKEEAEPIDPYVTRVAYCSGYDVYGDLVGQARWIEMLYLLFHKEPPTGLQAALFEALAVALANPGPRDPSVHAAMCAGVGGSTAASVLMAALSVGAGQMNGSREVYEIVKAWHRCGVCLASWQEWCQQVLDADPAGDTSGSVWPSAGRMGRVVGFDRQAHVGSTLVKQTIDVFSGFVKEGNTEFVDGMEWLQTYQATLEQYAQAPMTLMFPVATALYVLKFTPEQAELLTLLLRLPGAAAHALEQADKGYRYFPFGNIEVVSE